MREDRNLKDCGYNRAAAHGPSSFGGRGIGLFLCRNSGGVGGVNPPNLQALQRGDGAAWDEAFVWLWPAAFGAAQSILTGSLNHEAEDVAIEALEELIEKVRGLRSVEELKPLVASIAHH